MERLQKYLARAGIASRRRAEEMIEQGFVQVNGSTVTEMGVKIEPGQDHVTVNGQEVRLREEPVYFLFNKPRRVMTTLHDPEQRAKISDYLQGIKTRVYPVGRLDYLTEGLLILTNDGELAYRLTHPKYKVKKTYRTKVAGVVEERFLQRLQKGVRLEDGFTAPAGAKKIETGQDYTVLEITIHEGRNRQVRRMCEAIGHPVISLKRTKFGPLVLDGLPGGHYRALQPPEILALKKACQLD